MSITITLRTKNQHAIALTGVHEETWLKLESEMLHWADLNDPDYQRGDTAALRTPWTGQRVLNAAQARATRNMLLDLFETEPGVRPVSGRLDPLAYDVGQVLDCLTDESEVDIAAS